MSLPETVLQFGTGRFLRAFADLFIHQANQVGQQVGRIVLVQSTGDARAAGLNQQAGRYHVVLRGLENGETVDRVETVESVSRALHASSQWKEILELARSPQLRLILSNTTEAGYNLDPIDTANDAPPRAFPAKLLLVLLARFQAGQKGLTIVPCELRDQNANILKGLVLELAQKWNLSEDFKSWISSRCYWLNTLVDRIVTGTPKEHPLLAQDPLLTVGEPYALWAIQDVPGSDHFLSHPSVVWTPDVEPYFLRKVRLLNGGHSALLIKAWPEGFRTVRDAVNDPKLGKWLEKLLITEVVPVLTGRVEEPESFAYQVLDRFRNPFVDHKLADIAVHHADKIQVRLFPTLKEYQEKFGKVPPLLQEVLLAPSPAI